MRLSIRTMFLSVAVAGISLAALSQASLLWTRLIFTVTLLFIAWTIIGALCTKGSRQTFWKGAAVVSIGYFALLAYTPPGGRSLCRLLIKHQILESIAAATDRDWEPTDVRLWEGLYESDEREFSGSPSSFDGGFFNVPDEAVVTPVSSTLQMTTSPPPAPDAWRTGQQAKFDLRQRYRRYLVIGHCLFLMASGLAGGWCANRFFAPNEPEPAAAH